LNQNRLGAFILIGATLGALCSMLDRGTRSRVMRTSRNVAYDIGYYSKNLNALKYKLQEKTEKLQLVYDQIASDVSYIKAQVEELKTLTPQVKELVVNTKDAFVESKDEYKTVISEKGVH
jgi:gas vesicle protein